MKAWFVGVMVTSQIVDLLPRVQFPYGPHLLLLAFGKGLYRECEEQVRSRAATIKVNAA